MFLVRVLVVVLLAGLEAKGVFVFVVLVLPFVLALVVEVEVEVGPVFGLKVFDGFELDIFVLLMSGLGVWPVRVVAAYLHH